MPRERGRLRSLLLCFVLQGGVLFGVPMRPEEIRKLMQSLSGPTVEHVMKAQESGDGADEDEDEV